jgi:hypothetical protein
MKDVKSEASANSPMVKTEEAPPQLDHPDLKETGNGPTSSYEEALLKAYFGDPVDGVYGGAE